MCFVLNTICTVAHRFSGKLKRNAATNFGSLVLQKLNLEENYQATMFSTKSVLHYNQLTKKLSVSERFSTEFSLNLKDRHRIFVVT